ARVADGGRDSVRVGTHGETVCVYARRHTAGCADYREGAGGRVLPGVGGTGRMWAARPRQDVWRESAGVRGGSGVAAGAARRETGGALGGTGRVFPGEVADVAQPGGERGTRARFVDRYRVDD